MRRPRVPLVAAGPSTDLNAAAAGTCKARVLVQRAQEEIPSRLPGRRWPRRRGRSPLPGAEIPEVERLGELLASKVAPRADRQAFVLYSFVEPLRRYEREVQLNDRLHLVLSMLSIFGGLASSAVVAFVDNSVSTALIAVLGLVVGVSAGLNQLLRPSRRSLGFARASFTLRREAWYFVLGEGAYRGELNAAYARLVGRVSEETEMAEAVARAQDEAPAMALDQPRVDPEPPAGQGNAEAPQL
jgi:uncharacterized protein DUF4231